MNVFLCPFEKLFSITDIFCKKYFNSLTSSVELLP